MYDFFYYYIPKLELFCERLVTVINLYLHCQCIKQIIYTLEVNNSIVFSLLIDYEDVSDFVHFEVDMALEEDDLLYGRNVLDGIEIRSDMNEARNE